MTRPSPVKPDNLFLMLFNALRQRRIPLVLRIVSHTLLLVVLALVIHAWVMGLQFKHAMQQHADALGQSLIIQTAASATELLVANDTLSLSVLLNRLVENPLVAHAAIHSMDNRLLAEAGEVPAANLLDPNNGIYSAPITFQEVIAARITLRLDMKQFQQPMTISLQNMALLSVILLALTTSLSLRLGRRVTVPLLQLRDWARAPSYPAPAVTRQDEIGDLARELEDQFAPLPEEPQVFAEPEPDDLDEYEDDGTEYAPEAQPSPFDERAAADEDDEYEDDGEHYERFSALDDEPLYEDNEPAPQPNGSTAVLAVQLGTPEQLRALDRDAQLQLQGRFRECLERTVGLYRAELRPLKDGTSLLLFREQSAGPNYLVHGLCCAELLRAQSPAFQSHPGSGVALQLGLAEDPDFDDSSQAQMLLSEGVQRALALAQHSRNLLLLEPSLADDPALIERARIRPAARPEGACCVERLLPPYPALIERQLASLRDSPHSV